MDVVLLILAGMCLIVGIIGCIVPGLPGVPVAYVGLWIAQASERVDFSWQMLLIWGIVTVVVSVLDYVVPAWGTKRFGGTKYGVWGSTIGVFAGLFFGAIGVIVGPLAGARDNRRIDRRERGSRSAPCRMGQFYRFALWYGSQVSMLRSDDGTINTSNLVNGEV